MLELLLAITLALGAVPRPGNQRLILQRTTEATRLLLLRSTRQTIRAAAEEPSIRRTIKAVVDK